MAWHTTLPTLMLVTDGTRTRGRPLLPLVVDAVDGGVGIVVLRERRLDREPLRDLAERLHRQLPRGVPLLLNGPADVALELGLGLHRPAADPTRGVPWPESRPGPALLGRSAHDEREADVAAAEDASYLTLGTIFPTASKPGHPGAGVELVRRICRRVRPLPVFAIGGITVTRIPEVVHAGAHGVAVCGAILEARDPARQAQAMRLALEVATQAGEGPA